MVVNTKDHFWKPILIKGKLGMAFFIQEKGEFMLGGQNFGKLILKLFKVRSEKFEDFLPRLATEGNPFSFLNILHLERGKESKNIMRISKQRIKAQLFE